MADVDHVGINFGERTVHCAVSAFLLVTRICGCEEREIGVRVPESTAQVMAAVHADAWTEAEPVEAPPELEWVLKRIAGGANQPYFTPTVPTMVTSQTAITGTSEAAA